MVLKLPSTIGPLLMGLLASLLLIGLEFAFPRLAVFGELTYNAKLDPA